MFVKITSIQLDLSNINVFLKDHLWSAQKLTANIEWTWETANYCVYKAHGLEYQGGGVFPLAEILELLLTLMGLYVLCMKQFVDEAKFQIERHDRNVKQMGVLSYIPM